MFGHYENETMAQLRKKLRLRGCELFPFVYEFKFVCLRGALVKLNPTILF